MTGWYMNVVALAERVHRRALALLEAHLVRLEVEDLNGVQAMILWHMGHQEMTTSELILRGCYQGTNVTYNLKKLVEHGYVAQERSASDARVTLVRATERGRALLQDLDAFFADLERATARQGLDDEALAACAAALGSLDRLADGRRPSGEPSPTEVRAAVPIRARRGLAA